jgi:peptidoglycan/xylan/chitin deacetylase (PgdA/CDA1 family)
MQKQYHVFPENFEAQMQYLKDNGYTPISLATLDDHLINGTAIPNKSVVLTFDDGWKNQYEYAYPILKKFKFTGTFFIITGIVGKGGGYMTWDQIKDLQANGFDIESHSVTHPFLAKIKDSKKLEQELVDSKKTLEIKLGVPVTAIAYPYYNYNAIVEAAVKKAGYTAARAGWVKGINSKDSIYYLKSQESVNNQNPFSSIVAK